MYARVCWCNLTFASSNIHYVLCDVHYVLYTSHQYTLAHIVNLFSCKMIFKKINNKILKIFQLNPGLSLSFLRLSLWTCDRIGNLLLKNSKSVRCTLAFFVYPRTLDVSNSNKKNQTSDI